MRVSTGVVFAAAALTVAACLPTFETSHQSTALVEVSAFTEIETPFVHVWRKPSHPFSGAAVIDIDGDGKMEVFVGGGRGQKDMLLSYQNGKLVDIGSAQNFSVSGYATYGAASSDIDGDGDVDLIVARDDGVTVYINDAGLLTARPRIIQPPEDTSFLSVAISDIEGDGDADIYVSAFVSFPAFKSATFNDPRHARANVLLRNDGDFSFTNVAVESGTTGKQNTFHATFADLDGDRDADMILSQNTGEIEILENNGDGTFKDRPTNSGFGFWMGLAVGDIDADGDPDIFVSNIGSSIPDFLTKGDLTNSQRHNTEWALLKNDGKFQFTDVSEKWKLRGYGFAWGAQFEDLNLDGMTDLLVAQNYIKWPLHKLSPLPAKALLQLDAPEGRGFYQVEGLNLDNRYFGQSPIIVDLDADGRADVLWLNMDGPLRAFLNKSKGNFLTVRMPDNVATYGAKVTVVTNDGNKLVRQVIASTGLMTDPTPDVHFGLGKTSVVARVVVERTDGTKSIIESPQINSIIGLP